MIMEFVDNELNYNFEYNLLNIYVQQSYAEVNQM